MTRLVGRATVLALALAAACAPPAAEPEGNGSDEAVTGAIDWANRSVSLDAADWTLEFCEGDGPFLCVSRGGRHAGAVELLRWPLESHDTVLRVLASGGEPRGALAAAAADLVDTVEADRRIGRGPEYEVLADAPAPISSGGAPGVRSGFRGLLRGRVVERVVHYRFLARDTLFVIAAAAYEPDGCLAAEGDFTVADLDAVVPILDRVARANRFGAGGP